MTLTILIMNRLQLNKKISRLMVDLTNAQFRAGVIERRVDVLDRQALMLTDKRPRTVLLLENNTCSRGNWVAQLLDTYDAITLCALEIEEAQKQLANIPPLPVKSVRRDSGEKHTMVGLYRMGRVFQGRTPS